MPDRHPTGPETSHHDPASLLGGILHYSFRVVSVRPEAIKLNDRVVFYQGILSSPCGGWSVQSTKDAFVDLEKPFLQAVKDRLAALPRGAITARLEQLAEDPAECARG